MRVSTATICLDGCVAYAGNEIHVAMHHTRQEGVLESCADGGRLVRVGQSDFAVRVRRGVGKHVGPRFLGETQRVTKDRLRSPKKAKKSGD